MLDSETKAKIDSARDILVGKVPDPKSQVEQITIALIYKFMDDMDRQSEELGGKASFFTGDFKKYRWAQLLDKRYSGHERLLLYAEGIEKMNENKNIPQLFRDIFRGVFLPYRDPETLNLFLKEINAFTYEHSERLGDAFEYLLSVLGTQGDAGQFRTPRHIIDFIVAVVDPKKNETVLDPACGTAGFLISAFKHIMNCGLRNAAVRLRSLQDCGLGNGKPPISAIQNPLTPDERARLMSNFRGYDIAPDMVRLSRVNLYLHGFPNPVIHEYDTLTSEERWDERCDVIMANPPFMSPKGGIRPHNRFSIKAKRSEVLFVDYIAEHLNPGGRAGVIVPEGIIFQSQNAYKALRKMLIENYLWAVVSLPGGVFNPYSGVKTSILFFDRNLAKRTDDILFVKVENDGFDLGAQRRPVEGSDLVEAFRILDGHKKAHKTPEGNMALTVSRVRLLESPDISLSGDRYRVATIRLKGKWPMVKLSEVCRINPKKSEVSSLDKNLIVSFVPMEDIGMVQYITSQKEKPLGKVYKGYTYFRENDVIVAKVTPCFENGKSGIARDLTNGIGFGSSELHIIRPSEKVLPEFVYPFVTSDQFRKDGKIKMTGTGGLQRVPASYITDFEIPLPPLDEQERIVTELEGYRKVVEGARQIIASYKPTIQIDPEWPMVVLGDAVKIVNGRAYKQEELLEKGKYPVLRVGNFFSNSEWYYSDLELDEDKYCNVGDLLYAWSASFGPRIWKGPKVIYHYHIWKIVTSSNVEKLYLHYLLEQETERIKSEGGRGIAMIHITKAGMEQRQIPLPPLSVQRQIVAELEAERKLVEANRELIARMEAKIKAKLAEVWGENMPAEREA